MGSCAASYEPALICELIPSFRESFLLDTLTLYFHVQ